MLFEELAHALQAGIYGAGYAVITLFECVIALPCFQVALVGGTQVRVVAMRVFGALASRTFNNLVYASSARLAEVDSALIVIITGRYIIGAARARVTRIFRAGISIIAIGNFVDAIALSIGVETHIQSALTTVTAVFGWELAVTCIGVTVVGCTCVSIFAGDRIVLATDINYAGVNRAVITVITGIGREETTHIFVAVIGGARFVILALRRCIAAKPRIRVAEASCAFVTVVTGLGEVLTSFTG